MEIASSFTTVLSSQPFFVPTIVTALCLLLTLFAFTTVRSISSKASKSVVDGCDFAASANKKGSGGGGGCDCVCKCTSPEMVEKVNSAAVIAAERQTGASMMEQLVPEITTHALSYLDYPSLCRLSMTNSLMRKAANDDNAWKALYHKDFTWEQDSVTPANGWKAYYAATRAIVNINTEFFNIIRERSLPAMSRFWLNADFVKCVHASGELFSGYNAVIQSWQLAFTWEQGVNFQVRDVRARVMSEMAWVSMKTFVDMDSGPFNVTNTFEFHNGRWYMVHHHSSVMTIDGDVEQQLVHA